MVSNKFTFIAPMFNASQTLHTMLHSLAGQSYENWRLILIDDVSSEEERASELVCIEQFQGFKRLQGKIDVIWNKEKKWEVANVLHGISLADDDDIICRIDADDWLCELDALAMIDQVYQSSQCDILWTAHRWGFSDKNISGPMKLNADPYQHPWVSSHLKTFRKKLINKISDENFRGEDGEYIRRAGDQAIYLPILHQTTSRVFLPRVTYHYTIDDVPETYQTDDAVFQRDEAVFLRERGYVL